MSEWKDEQEEMENLINLHLAKIMEEMEWENTLPADEKQSRRLRKYFGQIFEVMEVASETGNPWLLLGHMERLNYHISGCFGADWMERAKEERSKVMDEWLGPDDDYESTP